MAEPIVEQIAVKVAAAIDEITVAAGYTHDLTALRPKRLDFADVAPTDCTVLVCQEDDEDNDEISMTGAQGWRQTFVLMAVVIDSDAAESSVDTRINEIKSDIRKKVRQDPTFGGSLGIIDTYWRGSAKFDDGRGLTGVGVIIDIDYRTKEKDPYTKA
ncbi:MAG: hypothetical protein ACYTEQ_05605 [Planctomycetota bacterium]|jgi:hypothetical protein